MASPPPPPPPPPAARPPALLHGVRPSPSGLACILCGRTESSSWRGVDSRWCARKGCKEAALADARSEAARKEFAKRRDWLAKRQGNVEGLHDDIAAAHRRNDTMRVAELKIALRRAEKSWRAFAQSLRDMLAAPPDELRPAKKRQEAVELGSAGTAAAAAAQALLKVDRFRTESARAAAEDEAAPLFRDFEAYFNPDKPRPPSPPRGPVVPDTETNYYGNLCACCLLSLLTLTYVSPSSFA